MTDPSRDALQRELDEARVRLDLLSSTLNAMTDGVLVLQHSVGLIFHNDRYLEMWNTPREMMAPGNEQQLLQYHASLVRNPEGHASEGGDLRLICDEEAIAEIELLDGRTIERHVIPQRLNGEHVGFVINFRDITEQKRFEDKMMFNHLVVENAGPMFWVDPVTGQVVYANRAVCEHLGYTPEELVGVDISQINPDFTPEMSRQVVETMRTTGKPVTLESRNRRKDGTVLDLEITAYFTRSDTQNLNIVTFKDVTEQKAAAEGIRRARDLAEEATKLKSDFLANMSHEIRTPMNAIIGMSHLALKTELTPRQREYISKLQSAGQHLLGVVNDILDFSKVEAGKLTIEAADFELEKVLDSVADVLTEKSTAKGLELLFDVAPDVPRRLVGDSLRLGQILMNFGSNSVKFTEQGEIMVSVRVHEMTEAGVLLYFGVTDTGIGLSDAQISRLFQSFQQADTSTTRKFGGTGLGLAISKKLAELMHGEVGVQSVPGHGSTFWFTARLGVSQQARRELIPVPDLRGRRALVVDDNDHARIVIGDMLEGMTFKVTRVSSGAAAIAEILRAADAGLPYEIVYLDWRMPGMDGIETVRRIKSLELDVEPALVMVTAHGREEMLRQTEGIGLANVLLKPISPSTLFDTSIEVLGAGKSRERQQPHADGVADATLAALKGKRILLVEDNDINQIVATEILQDFGLRVDVAGDGSIALEMVQLQPYDIVLMDMQMPVMDGVTATQHIRKLKEFARLPIIAMTANAMQQDRDKCMAAGMNDFLTKPINPKGLRDMLLQWAKAPAPSQMMDLGFADVQAGQMQAEPAKPEPAEPKILGHAGATPKLTPLTEPGAEGAATRRATPEVNSSTATPAGPAAPAPPRTSLFDGVNGLDIETGLGRMAGKKPLYIAMLRRFVAGQKTTPQQLGDAMDDSNWALALRLAHTLRGVSGTVGADNIQLLAGKLEQAITDKKPRGEMDRHLANLQDELQPLLTTLEQLLAYEALPAPRSSA